MTDSCKTTVLAGVAGGYLLGRTKKAKLALAFAAFAAGSRLGPRDLLEKGAGKVADTPQLAGLPDQLKDQVMTAVGALVDRRVESFSDSLRQRTDRLGELGEERDARGARDAEDEADDEDAEDEGRGRDTAAAKRKPSARKKKAAAGGTDGGRGTAKSSAGKTGKGAAKGSGKKPADRSRRR